MSQDDLHNDGPGMKSILAALEGEVAELCRDCEREAAGRRLAESEIESLSRDNAWKFTRSRSDALLEFGSSQQDGNPVYFVRDNGAGFDEAALNQLFKPFQPCAGDEKTKGHGIGLATVARIIERHGGSIWATGAVGKGATVSFTCHAAPDRPLGRA